MSAKYILDAEMREDLGKGASRRLRRVNKIPAVLYGAGRPAWSLTLKENQLMRNLQEESFYAAIIELTLDGKQQKVFLRDLQRHPAKPFVLHVDLQRVRDDVEMTVVLPLHYLNEETAQGVKMEGGQVLRNA
ncbi:MAG: 50S ribosomal protein L25, partial [Cocleimonas sp.]